MNCVLHQYVLDFFCLNHLGVDSFTGTEKTRTCYQLNLIDTPFSVLVSLLPSEVFREVTTVSRSNKSTSRLRDITSTKTLATAVSVIGFTFSYYWLRNHVSELQLVMEPGSITQYNSCMNVMSFCYVNWFSGTLHFFTEMYHPREGGDLKWIELI